MTVLTKQQEHILQYLLSLNCKTNNTISMSRNVYSLTNISEKDFVKCLDYFEKCQFISIHWYSPHHDDFNYARDIILLPDAINYFQNKKIVLKNNIKENIKWLLPLLISILSLIWNIINSICYSVLHDMLVK